MEGKTAIEISHEIFNMPHSIEFDADKISVFNGASSIKKHSIDFLSWASGQGYTNKTADQLYEEYNKFLLSNK